ncbi:MAG: TetR/AcrR family transcriptional regulator [Proteobacteria bacterium]|nr:TetR/AcrR family transcriptional regulator [Pseudomonadota bacterium]MBU1742527.1 TetR/AcrR family transcriptional regulator [Pseudomonadota bacterium]
MGDPQVERTTRVPTQVKNQGLVARRRRQIIDAAVHLFVDQGFHKTTTRQIAQAAGFSTGTLYEYVASKEDVLYLVCDAIHAEMERSIAEGVARAAGGREALAGVIREYFLVCDRMSDHILLIYQEAKSLPPEWRKNVLANEVRVTNLIQNVIARLSQNGDLPGLDASAIQLLAHNITVLGHMWTFRRWFLGKHYSIDQYIARQTALIMGDLIARNGNRGEPWPSK